MTMADKQFWDDLKWGENHHSDYLEKYRDNWVAISDKEIVAFGENLEKVEIEAKKKTGKDVPVIFVEGGEHIYGQS